MLLISSIYLNKKKYNNIIYYDENKEYLNELLKDCDSFEENTMGGFILCQNMETLKIVREEILKQNSINQKISFNLLTTGSTFNLISFILRRN